MLKKNARQLALLTLLVLSLTGCATRLPPAVVKPAQIPPPPPELLEEPDLSKSYSDSVRELLLQWRQKLTDWKRSS